MPACTGAQGGFVWCVCVWRGGGGAGSGVCKMVCSASSLMV
jgi:hypothetical protein